MDRYKLYVMENGELRTEIGLTENVAVIRAAWAADDMLFEPHRRITSVRLFKNDCPVPAIVMTRSFDV